MTEQLETRSLSAVKILSLRKSGVGTDRSKAAIASIVMLQLSWYQFMLGGTVTNSTASSIY